MNQLTTNETLRKENLAFVGTGGVSAENRSSGFLPAFYDLETGRAELSRFADGRPAPMHLLEGMPAEWVARRDLGEHYRAEGIGDRRLCARWLLLHPRTGCPGNPALTRNIEPRRRRHARCRPVPL